MVTTEAFLTSFAALVWGTPLLVLVPGGGTFFRLYSGGWPYLYFRHAVAILRGKFDDSRAEGDVPRFQAVASVLSGTLGLSNVAGVVGGM